MSAPDPEASPEGGEEPTEEEGAAGELPVSVDAIAAAKLQGDADGLLKLAKQFRVGVAGSKPDMKACFAAYNAAAELGSSVAQHAVGLFYLNGGGGVERSERDAALQFRAAADHGHLPSKVLVGNFYELGMHYRADAAKADVWYRNVARSANIEHEPDSTEYVAALANLGCVRYCMAIADDPETSEPERTRLRRLAKAYGYKPEGERFSITIETEQFEAVEAEAASQRGSTIAKPEDASVEAAPGEAETDEKVQPPNKKPAAAQKQVNVGLAMTGFLLTLLCMASGVVLGHVLRHGALSRVASGEPVPVFGTQAEAILPVFVLVFGFVPNLLFYRRKAFLKALVVAGVAGLGGDVLWATGRHLLETRTMQITNAGVAGMLVGLLVFGLLGGVKPGSK